MRTLRLTNTSIQVLQRLVALKWNHMYYLCPCLSLDLWKWGMTITAENFLLREWPHAGEVCLLALVIGGCRKTRLKDPKKQWHPLYDLCYTFFNTFATGFLGPLFVGEIPLPLTNDLIIPTLLAIWALFYRFDWIFVKLFGQTGILEVVVFFATLSRANNVCVFTDKAFKRISSKMAKGAFYPVPIFGPLVVGTIRGAGGLFFPPDKGLGELKAGMPFNVQIALICSAIWHFLVNDPFVVGGFARGVLLSLGIIVKPRILKCTIVCFFLFMNVLQASKISAHYKLQTANPFSPLWKILYAITGIPPSAGTLPPPKRSSGSGKREWLYDLKSRQKVEVAFDILKVAAVLVMFGIWARPIIPQPGLYAGQELTQGSYLSSCTVAPYFRSCEPRIAVMEGDGSLAVYKGTKPSDPKKELLWASPKKKKATTNWKAVVRDTGVLEIVDDKGKAAWKSPQSAASKKERNFMAKALLEQDGISVYKAGQVVWKSSAK